MPSPEVPLVVVAVLLVVVAGLLVVVFVELAPLPSVEEVTLAQEAKNKTLTTNGIKRRALELIIGETLFSLQLTPKGFNLLDIRKNNRMKSYSFE